MYGLGELYRDVFVLLIAVTALQASIALTAFSIGLSATGLNPGLIVRERRYILASTAVRNVIGPLIALAAVGSFGLDRAVALTIAALVATPAPILIPTCLLRPREANEVPALCSCQALLAIFFFPLTLKLLGAALGQPAQLGYLLKLLFLPVVAPWAA